MSLMADLLGDCSPYIFDLVYDIDVRMLFIECGDDPGKGEPDLRIVFPDVVEYSESNNIKKPEDDYVDDLVNLENLNIVEGDSKTIQITTYKKTINITLTGLPFTEEL